jgi:hypothetical protein
MLRVPFDASRVFAHCPAGRNPASILPALPLDLAPGIAGFLVNKYWGECG